MGKFKTVCGKEFNVSQNNTHATGVMLAREYPPDMAEKNFNMPDDCQKCKTPKQTFASMFCLRDSATTFSATSTTCIAVNVEHKEEQLAAEYGEYCSNTKETYVFEVVLQAETARAYVRKEIPSRGMSAFDHIKDMADTLWEDYQEQLQIDNDEDDFDDDAPMIIQMFDPERADCTSVEVFDVDELEKMIVSVRMIGFEQVIDGK
jgi:hypothetical protein